MAKPIKIEPMFFFLSELFIIIIMIPITARTGENDSGLTSLKIMLSPVIPLRLNSHAVTVVPIFAPRIMLIVWLSFIRPEFTNPTSITVVAEDDCIIDVTIRPRMNPLKRLDVNLAKNASSCPPASFFKPSPISSIPYRNKASPPISVSSEKMSI